MYVQLYDNILNGHSVLCKVENKNENTHYPILAIVVLNKP